MISSIKFSQAATHTVSAGNSSCTATFDDPLTPGESVIVTISFPSTASVTVSPTMVGGDASVLTAGPAVSGGGLTIQHWFMQQTDLGGETAVTFTLNSAVRANIHAGVFDALLYAAIEASDSSTDTIATITSDTITPTSDSNLVFVSTAFAANDYSSGPTNDFTRMTPVGGGGVWQEVAYKIQSRDDDQYTVWTLTGAVNSATVISVFSGLFTYRVDVEEFEIQGYQHDIPTEVRVYASDTFTAEGGAVVVGGRLNSKVYQKANIIADDSGRLMAEGFVGDNGIYPNNVRNIGLCSTYTLALYKGDRLLAPLYKELVVPGLVSPTSWDAIERYSEAV